MAHMKKIMDTVPLDIIPFSKGFLYGKRESSFRRDARANFFAYDVKTRRFSAVTQSVYLLNKFGPSYQAVADQLTDCIACAAGALAPNHTAVIYPSGEAGIFDQSGELSWTGDLVYHDAPFQEIAPDGKCFWSAVPRANSIVRYSPVLSRVVFRIGSETSHTFHTPASLVRYGSLLYVCSAAACKIRTVDLETYAVKDYRLFNEPVTRYFRSADAEIVVLQSGTYQL